MIPAEIRRRLSELHARRESNKQRWREEEREFQITRAALQSACGHENTFIQAQEHGSFEACKDCGKVLEAL